MFFQLHYTKALLEVQVSKINMRVFWECQIIKMFNNYLLNEWKLEKAASVFQTLSSCELNKQNLINTKSMGA